MKKKNLVQFEVFPTPQKHRLLTPRTKDLSQMKFSRKISKAGLQRKASRAYLCYVKRDPGSTPGSILTLLAVQTVHFPWVGGWDLGESCFFPLIMIGMQGIRERIKSVTLAKNNSLYHIDTASVDILALLLFSRSV